MQDFTLDKGKVAILLAGLFCLYAVYGAVSDFRLPGEAEALEPAQQIVELDPVNMQVLTNTHLFGQPPQVKVAAKKTNNRKNANNAAKKQQQAKAKQQQKQQKRAPKPIKINVTVTGLLASADNDFAAAMLKVDNKPEKLYKVGEDLGKPEVKLQSVELESVTIDNNGNEQTIAMKRPGLESNSSGQNGQRSNNRANNRANNGNLDRIPELPPELELPEELQLLNEAAAQGAYTPPPPELVDLNEPPLPEELQEELLLEEIQQELDQEIQNELGLNDNNNVELEVPPEPELDNEIELPPNFQMPVF